MPLPHVVPPRQRALEKQDLVAPILDPAHKVHHMLKKALGASPGFLWSMTGKEKLEPACAHIALISSLQAFLYSWAWKRVRHWDGAGATHQEADTEKRKELSHLGTIPAVITSKGEVHAFKAHRFHRDPGVGVQDSLHRLGATNSHCALVGYKNTQSL